jgi:lipopolysaccharide biosynthesis regulator YciM
LGDLTRDPKYWHQAWTANGEDKHYARAMRSLGAWHYKRGEFAECVECYEKALAINALFENSWFTLGCAAMQLQNWPVAQKAFTRCVSLEPENGEAWNNLAAVNLQVDRKRDAMRCLREGLKDKRENWKMWENFTYIALDLGEFSDALLGTERLLALRWHKDPTTIDYEVLRALTDGIAGLSGAIVSELASAANEYRPLRMLSDRLGELLREIVVDYACGKPEAWRLFAHYHKSNNNQKDYLTALQSAYRAFQQSSAADQIQFDGAIFKECAELLAKLVDAYLDGDVKGVCTDGRFQARLILRSFLKRTKVGDD